MQPAGANLKSQTSTAQEQQLSATAALGSSSARQQQRSAAAALGRSGAQLSNSGARQHLTMKGIALHRLVMSDIHSASRNGGQLVAIWG